MNFSKSIRLIRSIRGMTQKEVAEKAGVSIPYLSLLEREKRDPTLATMIKIAKALECSLIMLILMGEPKSIIEDMGQGVQDGITAWLGNLVQET